MRSFLLLLGLAFLLAGEVHGTDDKRCVMGISLTKIHPTHRHPTPFFERNSKIQVSCVCPQCPENNTVVSIRKGVTTFHEFDCKEYGHDGVMCEKEDLEKMIKVAKEKDGKLSCVCKATFEIAYHSETSFPFPPLLCDWEECNNDTKCRDAAQRKNKTACIVTLGKTKKEDNTSCASAFSAIQKAYPKPCGKAGKPAGKPAGKVNVKMLSIICSSDPKKTCPFDVTGPVKKSAFDPNNDESCGLLKTKGGDKIGDTTQISDGDNITLPTLGQLTPECHWLTKTGNLTVWEGNVQKEQVTVNMSQWKDWRYKLLCIWTNGTDKFYWFRWYIAKTFVHQTDPETGATTCHMPPTITATGDEGCAANGTELPICFNHDNMEMLIFEDYIPEHPTTTMPSEEPTTPDDDDDDGQKAIDDWMLIGYITGVATGVVVAIILCVVIFKKWWEWYKFWTNYKDVDTHSPEKDGMSLFLKQRGIEYKDPDEGHGTFAPVWLDKGDLKADGVSSEDLEDVSSTSMDTEEEEVEDERLAKKEKEANKEKNE